jgi:hypothetical protein
MDDRRASLAVATAGEVMEADDEDRDLFARFGGCSAVKLVAWDTAEFGSDSAFLFIPVCSAGRDGGLGGGDRGFCAGVAVAV